MRRAARRDIATIINAIFDPNIDLSVLLPTLLPKAIAWAESLAVDIARHGAPLDAAEIAIAQRMGVRHAELIRVVDVDRMPAPTDAILREAASKLGMLGPGTAGLTLGYGVWVACGQRSMRLLSHEFRHVFQYEAAGGIAAFMPIYLDQVVRHGYWDAPLERDARAHETNA
ncbi:hypothetical protein C7S18_19530 [Ahniella affigens]|uniref:DUF4157 domain-containing protein n=1 Tax=Ahniella affigens TaxID=2021234 RepID=A0A2P1PWI9_9GAMM|nr:hypothetical protein [Ahniella affigens]AVP99218.1 hypothetical protein C7S18_19530 [Ahniella affigens]